LENSPLVPIDGWSSFDDEFLRENSSIIRSNAGYFFMLFSLEEPRTQALPHAFQIGNFATSRGIRETVGKHR